MVMLTRGVPPAMQVALAGVVHPVLFVWLDWPGGAVRAHSGIGVITWGGFDWQGVGNFGGVTTPEEFGGSMVATEASVTLMASPEDLDAYLDDQIRNREGAIYMGLLAARPGEPGGGTLISDPVPVFYGTMDALSLSFEPTDTGVTSRASVTLVTGPGARSAATVTHSDPDQRRQFPADTAGRLVVLSYARAQSFTWPES
jgi:hypothetical protein